MKNLAALAALAAFVAQAAATPVPVVANEPAAAVAEHADIEKDFAYYSFKDKKERREESVSEDKRADIDKDFAYFSFKDKKEKRDSSSEPTRKRAPWDAELDFANYEFKREE